MIYTNPTNLHDIHIVPGCISDLKQIQPHAEPRGAVQRRDCEMNINLLLLSLLLILTIVHLLSVAMAVALETLR